MTILDDALSGPRGNIIPRHHWDRLQMIRRRSENFVFSSKASDLIGRFVAEAGELVIDHRQFAIPPFNDMFIEFDARAFHKHLPADPDLAAENADDAVGYLISGHDVFTVAANAKNGATILPGYLHIVPPGAKAGPDHVPLLRFNRRTGEYEAPPPGTTEWVRLAVILGSTLAKLPDEDARLAVASEVSFRSMMDPSNRVFREHYVNFLRTTAGDCRNVWAFLLWLNRPKHTLLVREPARRSIRKGRQTTYAAYRTVEIDLGKARSIRRVFELSGPRLPPKRHRVRGAFHHAHGDVNHGHVWPLEPDVDGHWQCKGCGRLRWWVNEHVRGDATRGWVDKDYAVIVEPENV